MNGSALAGSRAGSHVSAGSSLGHSPTSHTGVNNSAFASAHLGNTSTLAHNFGGRGFDRGRGFDHDRGFRDHDRFGFGCFGCGFGFGWGWGWGFGWGWGWGGWWGGPWWWDPFWWGPSPAYYDPWWGWAPPQPATVPGDFSLYYGNSDSSYNAPYTNPSSGYDTSNSFSASLNSEPLGSPNLNPLTDNVANSTPTILLYLKDGTMLAASDYWISDNKLHYLVNYGGESTVEMDQVDLQRTVDENGKRGVRFWLKASPNRSTESPAASPAPAPAPSHEAPVESAYELQPAD